MVPVAWAPCPSALSLRLTLGGRPTDRWKSSCKGIYSFHNILGRMYILLAVSGSIPVEGKYASQVDSPPPSGLPGVRLGGVGEVVVEFTEESERKTPLCDDSRTNEAHSLSGSITSDICLCRGRGDPPRRKIVRSVRDVTPRQLRRRDSPDGVGTKRLGWKTEFLMPSGVSGWRLPRPSP